MLVFLRTYTVQSKKLWDKFSLKSQKFLHLRYHDVFFYETAFHVQIVNELTVWPWNAHYVHLIFSFVKGVKPYSYYKVNENKSEITTAISTSAQELCIFT